MNISGENQVSPEGTAIDRWAAFGVFTALLFLYWHTLCPTVGVGDSGELVTAAYTLGITHPTGFPLYILLGKLFIHLFPVGEVAYRMNLFSAVAAAGAGAVFYRLMRVLGNPYRISFSAALTLGCSLSFWSQATVARVYSLNALLTCLCLYYLFLPVQNSQTRARFFFWWGLALANHTLSIIIGMVFIGIWLIKRDFSLKGMKACLFMVPGLSLYLYIPLRSRMNPSLDIGNPETISTLWAYLSREKYWGNRYVETLSDVQDVLRHYLISLPGEFTWLGAALIFVGIYYLVTRREYKILFMALSLFIVNIFLVMSHGSIYDIFQWSRYLIPGYIGMSLVIGYGLRFCCEEQIVLSALGSRQSAYLNKLFTWGLPILLPIILLWSHFTHNNRSEDYLAYDYSYKALSLLPEGAAIFPMGDNTAYPMLYLQKVLGIREDVKIHMSYYEQDRWIMFDNSRELFFTDFFQKIPADKTLRPDGLVFRLMNIQDSRPPVRNWESWKVRGIDNPNIIKRDFLIRSLVARYWYFMALAMESLKGGEYTEKLLRHCVDVAYDNDGIWAYVGLYYNHYYEKNINPKKNLRLAKKYLTGALQINAKNKSVANILEKLQSSKGLEEK